MTPKPTDKAGEKNDLMKPRYKVIADWPDNNTYAVGMILFKTAFSSNPDNYPHLFKPLQWWEERRTDEMPEYVKSISTALSMKRGEVCKVKQWTKDIGKYGVWLEGKSFSRLIETVVPSNEHEYESWLQLQEDLKNEEQERFNGIR